MCMHTLETPDTDGLDAALAAGFQTRLPGWDYQESKTPFGVQQDDLDTRCDQSNNNSVQGI